MTGHHNAMIMKKLEILGEWIECGQRYSARNCCWEDSTNTLTQCRAATNLQLVKEIQYLWSAVRQKTTCACVLTHVNINIGVSCLKCCHLKYRSLTLYCVKVSSSFPGCYCSSGDCRRRCLLCVVPQDGQANRTSREGITSATRNTVKCQSVLFHRALSVQDFLIKV